MILLLTILKADLTALQREAFIDTHIMGRSQEQVAREWGCTRANVSNHVRAAERRLRSRVTRQWYN